MQHFEVPTFETSDLDPGSREREISQLIAVPIIELEHQLSITNSIFESTKSIFFFSLLFVNNVLEYTSLSLKISRIIFIYLYTYIYPNMNMTRAFLKLGSLES